jgi:iron complex transport system substrate-binding protein
LNILQKSGLKVMFMEIGRTIPSGKAEWIKFFGALYGLDSANQSLAKLKRIQRYFGFSQKDTKANSSQRSDVPRSMVRTTRRKLGGSISKRCLLIIYGETKGTGILPFEVILEKAQQAEF